jgi:hypothetical protein
MICHGPPPPTPTPKAPGAIPETLSVTAVSADGEVFVTLRYANPGKMLFGGSVIDADCSTSANWSAPLLAAARGVATATATTGTAHAAEVMTARRDTEGDSF